MPPRVDDRRLADAAARLHEGRFAYTPRQLYYAVCASMERPQVSVGNGQIIGGGVMLVGGVVLAALTSVYLVGLAVIGAAVLGLGLQNRRLERARPSTRPLALSYQAFSAALADRRPPGLLDGGDEPASPAPGAFAAVVVCDRGETAAVLAANAGHVGEPLAVVSEDRAAALAGAPRVLALHDADREGCALPLRLLRAGAADVVDLGLRPTDVLERRVQVIEGAPAVVPPDTGALLHPDDIVWLADGRRVELAVLTPRQLVEWVSRALAAPRAPAGSAPRVRRGPALPALGDPPAGGDH